KIFAKRGLAVDARQMADGRSVRDAMVAGQLDAGTMNITPFIVGAAASGLVMAGVVSLGGDTVGVVARRGAGIGGIGDLEGIGVTLMRFGAIDPNPTCLVLTPGLTEEAATATLFLRSWLDGVDYWRNHAGEVADVLVQLATSAGYANVTTAVAEALVKQIK